MTSIASWIGTGAAVIVAGLCWLLLHHLHHLPSNTHPWLHRLAIIGMYCAGTVAVITVAGEWLLTTARSALGLVNASTAPSSGLGWALVTLGALCLAATIAVAVVWVPNPSYAYLALVTPLVLALAPAGFAHQIYDATSAPAQAVVMHVSTWAGG